jgi:hypothetical protein
MYVVCLCDYHTVVANGYCVCSVVLFYCVLTVVVAPGRDGGCSVCEDTDFVWWGWCPGPTISGRPTSTLLSLCPARGRSHRFTMPAAVFTICIIPFYRTLLGSVFRAGPPAHNNYVRTRRHYLRRVLTCNNGQCSVALAATVR